MYQRRNAPQTIFQVLEHGVALFRASINDVFVLAFIGAAIGQIPGMLGLSITPGTTTPQITGPMGFTVAGAFIISVVLYGAILARINAKAASKQLSMAESVNIGLRKGPSLFLAGFILFVAMVLGLSAFIIPGVIIMITFMFCFHAIIVNDMGPLQGLSYSQKLVWQQWWHSVSLVAVLLSGVLVLLVIIGQIANFVSAATGTESSPEPLPWYVYLLVFPLISAVVTPLINAVSLAIFYDLELRHSNTAE